MARSGRVPSSFDRVGIRGKLRLILLLILPVAVLTTAAAGLTLGLLWGLRAYVAGEGLYSKYQKDAVFYLERYVRDGDERYFRGFRDAIAVPLADGDARRALELAEPDVDAADRAFRAARNHPEDVPWMIFLFRYFQSVPQMYEAVGIWRAADPLVDALVEVAETVHEARADGALPEGVAGWALERIESLNGRLITLEESFSEAIGDGFRWATRMVFGLLVVLNGVLIVGALMLGNRIGRGIVTQTTELERGVERIAAGDRSVRVPVLGGDELGRLAEWFNQMAANLQHADEEVQRTLSVLTAAEEELLRSNQELRQFAYVASHDLQEPLRTVASYVQLLKKRYEGRLDADADDFIRFAAEGATRMQLLIRDLLAYSRVDTRAEPPGPVSSEDVLRRVVSQLDVSIREANARVTNDPLPVVTADESQLEQVFLNLLSNAIKFRSDRPPEVHVSAERNDTEWIFSVRDNGIGVAPEFVDRIFVIFQRLHAYEQYPGTGIGLAICKKIIERHQGRIWIEPAGGGGADFRFSLPVS